MCLRIYTENVFQGDFFMKRALFLIVTTIILSFFQTRNAKAQSIEDFIIWEADSNRIEQFSVHPNGNIIASQSGIAYEIDGQTGKILLYHNP